MPRGRKIRIYSEFKTDPDSLRECLSKKSSDTDNETSNTQAPEYEESVTDFGVIIRKHLPTGTEYIESEDMKIWIFPGAIRMVADNGLVFMRHDEAEIPEEQRELFGYGGHAGLFSGSEDTETKAWGGCDQFSPKIRAVVCLCLSYWIPSRKVSEIVGVLPNALYKIARRMDGTFDYIGKHRKGFLVRSKDESAEDFRKKLGKGAEKRLKEWQCWVDSKGSKKARIKPYDM